jgi:hypothetical protein
MNYRHILSLTTMAFGLVACNLNAFETKPPKVLGILEVAINNNSIGVTKFIPAKLGSQAVINENEITFAPAAGIGGTNVITESNAPRNFDYVSRIFTITNNAGGQSTINNLTLVALAQTGNVAPTTAIKTINNFNGNALTAATAEAARPTHRMTGAGIVVVDNTEPYRASFQAFTPAEVSTMQTQANALSYNGTVLEYGFVASSTGATSSRTITDGTSANVAIAMRFPAGGAGGAAGAYNFTMTFIVLEGGATRVTKSPEESISNTNARAGNVSTNPATTVTKVLIDNPAVNTTAGYTIQNNLKIGTGANQTLLKNPAKLVLARVSAGGSTGGAVYTSDFAEIFNAGEFSALLSGKSLQYSTSNTNLGVDVLPNVNTFDLTTFGTIPPGVYRVISTPNQSGSGIASPTSDFAAWTTAFNFASGGKVAIVNQTTALGCGGKVGVVPGGVPCDSTQDALLIDLIGYQRNIAAVKFEGTPFDYTSQTNLQGNYAFARVGNGCTDTDNNSTDFVGDNMTNSSARNSSTTPFICP